MICEANVKSGEFAIVVSGWTALLRKDCYQARGKPLRETVPLKLNNFNLIGNRINDSEISIGQIEVTNFLSLQV